MTAPAAYTLTRPFDDRQTDRGEDWRERASCTQVPIAGDDDPWFPEGQNPQWAPARRVCQACPVRLECLDAALVEEYGRGRSSRDGMRGALTPTERWRLEVAQRPEQPPRPAPQRDRVVAMTKQGMNATEIGAALNIVPSVVHLHRRRARALGELPAVGS